MIRTRSRKSQLGFSLAEILVAVAVFAIIFIAALMIYDRSNRVFKMGVESSNTQQSTRVAFDRLTADVRMAGFDYDRDGIPTGSVGGVNQSQQPDEQIEYIGPGAFTMRGNFDYETDAANQNGREQAYEPVAGQFPLVTTGNDEIVTYTLMTADTSASTPVRFFADSFKPRKVYTVSMGTPEKEKEIIIDTTLNASGQTLRVDQTGNFPPYTLYRVTLNDGTADGTPVVFTPVAENVRSLTYQYYEDAAGTVPLRDLAGVVIPQANLATTVGGLGQYDPADPAASLTPRAIRAKIQSVRVTLIGMNEAPDFTYTDPYETLPGPVSDPNKWKRFRKYRLESLVTPRNYARRGMREQEFTEPGPPTLTRVCNGYCGIFFLEWQAPPPAANTGSVESYGVLYDTDLTGGFAGIVDVGNVTSAFISVPDPSANWYFAIEAINSYGAAISVPMGPFSGQNATKPLLNSADVKATGGALPVQPNQVGLEWKAPSVIASGAISCSSGLPSPIYPVQETKGYQVYRKIDDTASGTDQDSDPLVPANGWTLILDENASGTGAPVLNPITKVVTWTDMTSANCVDYWYRIRAVERCPDAATNAVAATDGYSDFTTAVPGRAESTNIPDDPFNLIISPAPASDCDINLLSPTYNSCQVRLEWTKVTSSHEGSPPVVPLNIDTYRIERRRGKVGIAGEIALPPILVTSQMYTELSAGNLIYTDTSADLLHHDPADMIDYYYWFRVIPLNCGVASPTGSPERKFPCDFTGGTINMTPENVLQGSGTLASPWLISSGGNFSATVGPPPLNLNPLTPVTYMRATLFLPSGASQIICEKGPPADASPPFTSMTCGWPGGLPDETLFRVSIFAQDPASPPADPDACASVRSFYLMESNNNCCLTPQSVNPALVFVDGPGQRVRIRLDNNCSEPLTIQNEGVIITWNSTLLSGSGGKRLTRVTYPRPSGGTTDEDLNDLCSGTACVTNSDPSDADDPVVGLTVVPANSSSYLFTVRFNRNFTINPITKLCVQYQRPSDLATQTCKIIPVPSNTINVCD